MREILFRGKTYNDKWVQGLLVQMDDRLTQIRKLGSDGIGYYDYSIVPSTVGQYTGLTDKNGKKIFEGDIVKVENNDHDWYEHDPNSYSVFAVDFDEGGYTVGSYFLQNWLWFDEFHGEVIGNIHDNPELLEVTE